MLVALSVGLGELLFSVAVRSNGMLLRAGSLPLRPHPAFLGPLLPVPALLRAGGRQLSAALCAAALCIMRAGSVSDVRRACRPVRASRGYFACARLLKSGLSAESEYPAVCTAIGSARHR